MTITMPFSEYITYAQGYKKASILSTQSWLNFGRSRALASILGTRSQSALTRSLKERNAELVRSRDQLQTELAKLRMSSRVTRISELETEVAVCHEEIQRQKAISEVEPNERGIQGNRFIRFANIVNGVISGTICLAHHFTQQRIEYVSSQHAATIVGMTINSL